MNLLRNKLFRTGILAAGLLLAGNPVADRLGLKYWMPGFGGNRMSVFAYQSMSEPFDVLFLGSSRMRTLALPRLAEERLSREVGRDVSAFNLAQPQTNALGFSIVLRDVVASNGCPELIVYELTPVSVQAGTDSTTRVLEEYASLRDIPSMVDWPADRETIEAVGRGLIRGHANLALLLRRPPIAPRYRFRLARVITNRGVRADRRAEEERLSEPYDEEAEALALELQAASLTQGYRIAPAAKDAVASAIDIAKRCDTELVFVNPPVRPAPGEAHGFDEPAFQDYVRDLAATAGAEYHDLESHEMGLTEDDFRDRIHFTEPGAQKLMVHISTKILLPHLAGKERPGGR